MVRRGTASCHRLRATGAANHHWEGERSLHDALVGRKVLFGGLDAGAAHLEDDGLEGVAELLREKCVKDGINSRIAVSEPEEDREDEGGRARAAERTQQIHGEEGQPTENESANDYCQSFGGFCLHSEALGLVF